MPGSLLGPRRPRCGLNAQIFVDKLGFLFHLQFKSINQGKKTSVADSMLRMLGK